ncbi:hypothetical protein JK165_07705 [Acetobacter okinawensis]|uniref:hypothetical protein n=1 Tax=Acetobacter okinawensis TaxID=1076594 RepID=UPI001BAD8173|nr:hypothetical protein [Acetobacter okinawensis]MBS0965971.1 hypothetical protein [Acetobacter okinawensis]
MLLSGENIRTILSSLIFPAIISITPWLWGVYIHPSAEDIPPIAISEEDIAPTDPFELTRLKLKLLPENLRVPEQDFKILRIAQTNFSNIGKNPIVPSDIYEPLTVTVSEPWKIADVKNTNISNDLNIKWNKISDLSYSATPFLMNPNDNVFTQIVLIAPQNFEEGKVPKPSIKWTARIKGLSGFTPKSEHNDLLELMQKENWGIQVHLYGSGTVVCILYIVLVSLFCFYISEKYKIFQSVERFKFLIYSFFSIIITCGAEATATLSIKNPYYLIIPAPKYLNVPFIIFNFIIMFSISYRAMKISKRIP